MTDDWTNEEIVRAFLDFRQEMRDEIKWIRRLLIGSLLTAVVASIGSSIFAVVRVGG